MAERLPGETGDISSEVSSILREVACESFVSVAEPALRIVADRRLASWSIACATRTREEVLGMRAPRPLSLRDDLRIKGMLDRCSACGACPLIVRALRIMGPAQGEPASAKVIKLAG